MTEIRIYDEVSVRVPSKEIRPFEKNPKRHPKSQIERLKKNIVQFGFRGSLMLESPENKVIVCGHGRFQAGCELGMQEFPVVYAKDLTPEQVRAYRIADNKLAESSWDDRFLIEELSYLKNEKADLESTGFTIQELGKYFEMDKNELDVQMQREVTCPKCHHTFKIDKKERKKAEKIV